MAKYCYNCGAEIKEDDAFCTKCGAKQQVEEMENIPVEKMGSVPVENKVAPKKLYLFAIIGIVAVIVLLVSSFIIIKKPFSGKNSIEQNSSVDQPKLSNIEEEINQALKLMFEGTETQVADVQDFEVKNQNESTHDKSFSCNALNGQLAVMGLSKDGNVIQMQTLLIVSGDIFDQTSDDEKAALVGVALFPASIFDDSIKSLEDYNEIIHSFEDVENSGISGDSLRYIDGDIEYAMVSGYSDSSAIVSINIRYLPAFSGNSYFSGEEENSEQEGDLSSSGTATDSNVIAAGKMFESFLDGKEEVSYDDPYCNGSILICKEEPSEDNNGASYSIAGRGFSPFYDTNCIDVSGDTYVFYNGSEFGGAYYKIDVVDQKMFIYWSESLDMGQYELCGQIGESEETKSRDEAEKLAKEFFKRIQGTYINEGYDGTVTIAATEAFGFNNNANYSLEGVGMTTLYDTYCTSVVNGDEYYFELYDECYRIVDGENIMICRGSSKDDCYTVCAYLEKKIDLMNIDTYSLAGRYISEQNSNMEFSMSMYSDYVEIGDEVGNITIGYLKGLVYWEDSTNLGVMLDDGDYFNMKAYQQNGEIILEIDGNGIYSGTYKMVERYVS